LRPLGGFLCETKCNICTKIYVLTLEKGRKALMFSCLFCSDSKYIFSIDSAVTIYVSCNVTKSRLLSNSMKKILDKRRSNHFKYVLFSHPCCSWLFLALLLTWIRYQEIIICIVDLKSNGIFIYTNLLQNKTDILLKVALNTNNCTNTISSLFHLLI
jgi:hypothetical protein